jgi:O-acetyl-ADP-ribose deacetylase (regulator of RNase III)
VALRFTSGDLFNSGAEALVNPVNCVGVMGKGLALQFKKRFPRNFDHYKQACDSKSLQPGHVLVVETGDVAPAWIINLPTKRHWRAKSQLGDIVSGLQALRNELLARGIQSVAIPALGAGLGGLSWAEVRSAIETELAGLDDMDVWVFEPR